jgi:hypothetical protein
MESLKIVKLEQISLEFPESIVLSVKLQQNMPVNRETYLRLFLLTVKPGNRVNRLHKKIPAMYLTF